MSAIKIIAANSEKIESALHDANGRSVEHTFSTYVEIERIAERAEKAMAGLLYKKDFFGAEWAEISGGKVANSYKGSRNATAARIVRRTGGWYLISVGHTTVGNHGGGAGHLYLTESQDVAAKAKLAEGYSVR